MKRSEMVEGMVSQWFGLFNEVDEELREETYENMSKLLAFLEYKGMMPPYSNVARFSRAHSDGHEWEPE